MTDRVMEEIRARRRKLLRDRYEGSIAKLVEAGREWQRHHPKQVVNLRKRQIASAVA